MVLTLSIDKKQILVQSIIFSDFLLYPTDYSSLTISSNVNCSSTNYTKTITISDVNTSGQISLNSSFFGQGDDNNILDGVYSFTINATKVSVPINTSGIITTESDCMLVDNNLKCLVSDAITNNVPSVISPKLDSLYLDYFLLHQLNTCTNCNCQNLCDLYKCIINVISNNNQFKNINTKDSCANC